MGGFPKIGVPLERMMVVLAGGGTLFLGRGW